MQALEAALAIAAQGNPVFPCARNKHPAIANGHGFHDAVTDASLVRALFAKAPHATLVGTPTGEIAGFDVLDIDYRNGGGVWEQQNSHRLPGTRIHRSMSGGRHYLFRHAPGVRNNASKIAPGIDLRGDGGYVIMPPSNGYAVENNADIAEWPDWLLELVLARPPERRVNGAHHSVGVSSRRIDAFIGAILNRVRTAPEGAKHYTLRNAALSIGGVLYQAGLSEADAASLLRSALPATVLNLRNAEKTIEWGLARGAERPIELDDNYSAPVIHLFETRGQTTKDQAEEGSIPTDQFPASPLDWDAMEAVEARRWIYGHFLIRGFVSVLAGPGGVGKTSYSFAIALAIVTGLELLRETVHCPGNVWVYVLEDPIAELHRRLRAAIIHHGISRAEVEGRLYIDSGRDRPLVIARTLKDGTIVAEPVIEPLVRELREKNINTFIIDPFIRSHRVSENVNEHIDFVVALWAEVADRADCAVLLDHHFRKGGVSGNGDASAFRGASSLVDAARAARSLATMSEQEAERLGVDPDHRGSIIRVDNAKLNLAPPPTEAVWLRLVSICLDNGAKDRPADYVQAVERWEAPSPWDGMPMTMVLRILDKIQAGPGNGEFYAYAASAKDRWAGSVLMDDASRTIGQAKAILKAWKEAGLLTEDSYKSPRFKGKDAGRLQVSPAKVAEMRRQVSTPPEGGFGGDQ